MFVLTMKTTRFRVLVGGGMAALTVLAALALSYGQGMTTAGVAVSDPATYLARLGYETPGEWADLREVTIPVEWDETFTAYNELQQETGFDLTAYRGERVKRYTYTITNYPGETGVQAAVYVWSGRVIAGDVSATAADGFSHGLKPCPQEQGETDGTTG